MDVMSTSDVHKSPFYQNLSRGFQLLSDVPPKIVVNVIDPVRKAPASSASAASYFSRFNQYIQHKCNFQMSVSSTASMIQNAGISTQESTVPIPIQLVANASPRSNHSNSSVSMTPKVDSPEWYADPTCHIYLAPCSSLEQYKKSVKASISAFFHQIQGSTSSSITTSASTNNLNTLNAARQAAATAKSVIEASGHYHWSRQCVLILFPVREASSIGNSPVKDNHPILPRSVSLDDMMKKSIQPKSSSSDMDESTTARYSLHVSKEMKALYKQVVADFPLARTCILSCLGSTTLHNISEEKMCESLGDDAEWDALIQSMSDAISCGFQDRIHRYEEDLQGMDLQLSSAAQSRTRNAKRKDHEEYEDDDEFCSLMRRYFLVKEGLALSYLQIHAHIRVLKYYEDMHRMAVITTGKWNPHWEDWLCPSSNVKMNHVTLMGDSRMFRQILCYENRLDVGQLFYWVNQYAVTKQVQLLFLLDRPLEVMQRWKIFLEEMYAWKSRSSKAYKEGEGYIDEAAQLVVEAWCIEMCWDLYTAYNQFYLWSSGTKISPASGRNPDEVMAAAKYASDFLRFLRERALCISRILFSSHCPLYRASLLFLHIGSDRMQEDASNVSSTNIQNEKLKSSVQKCTSAFSWVGNTFESQDEFEAKYFQFYNSLVTILNWLGLRRSAARLLLEQAEIFSIRGDFITAAMTVVKIFDSNGCSYFGWSGVSSWVYYRLSSLHRLGGFSSPYAHLLLSVLSSPSNHVSPTVTNILQIDLESSMREKDLCVEPFSISPFVLLLSPTHGHYHTVGVFQTVLSTVTIRSLLSHSVTLDSLCFITKCKFVATDGSEPYSSENELKIEMNDVIVVNPGINTFPLEWVPTFPGIYQLRTAHAHWNEATFVYEKFDNPTAGPLINVLPYEPDQKLHVFPTFLYPRGSQQVKLTLDASSDYIEEVRLEIKCADNIQILKSLEGSQAAEWCDSLTVIVGPCMVGEVTNKTIIVQTNWQDTIKMLKFEKGLDIKVVSKYRHPGYLQLPQNLKDSIPSNMTCLLTASVDVIGSPPFFIAKADGFQLANGSIIINLKLNCQSSRPTSLLDWRLEYPPQYLPTREEDLNAGILKQSLIDGDEVYLTFKCRHDGVKNDKTVGHKPILHIAYENEISESFSQDFNVDIDLDNLSMVRSRKGTSENEVLIVLKAASEKGISGDPVSLVYTLEKNSYLSSLRHDILYSIRTCSSDWFVAGKYEGIIDWSGEDSVRIECIGIPMRAGYIQAYPSIHLSVIGDNSPSLLSVKLCQPRPFQSIPRTEQTIFAIP